MNDLRWIQFSGKKARIIRLFCSDSIGFASNTSPIRYLKTAYKTHTLVTLSTQKRLVFTQLLFQIFVWCKRITKIKENMASIKAVKPKEPGDVGPKAPAMKPAPKKAEQKPKEPKKKVKPNPPPRPPLLLSVCIISLFLSKNYKSWKMTDVNCWFKQGKSGRPSAKKKGVWSLMCFLRLHSTWCFFFLFFFFYFFFVSLMYPEQI